MSKRNWSINLRNKRWVLGLSISGAALFLFANAGFRDLVARAREKRRVERHLVRLRADHRELAQQWAQIKNDPAYTENLIRRTLGFVKKGEVEYQILVSSRS